MWVHLGQPDPLFTPILEPLAQALMAVVGDVFAAAGMKDFGLRKAEEAGEGLNQVTALRRDEVKDAERALREVQRMPSVLAMRRPDYPLNVKAGRLGMTRFGMSRTYDAPMTAYTFVPAATRDEVPLREIEFEPRTISAPRVASLEVDDGSQSSRVSGGSSKSSRHSSRRSSHSEQSHSVHSEQSQHSSITSTATIGFGAQSGIS